MILFYRSLVILTSLFSVILIIITDEPVPSNLFLIPLIYLCLFSFLPMFSKFMFHNVGITIVNITMFIRYAFSPLLMAFFGVNTTIGTGTSMSSQSSAVNMMVFEMAAVFITFALFYKKFYSFDLEFKKIKAKPNVFGWLFILFSISILAVNPEILGRYAFIWTASELKSKTAVEASSSIFFLVIQLAQIVLTVSLLNWVYKFYEKRPSIIYLIVSFAIIGISASFITGTSRFSIILPLATGLFTIIVLYKNYRKLIIIISVIMTLVIISVSTILKQSTISNQAPGLMQKSTNPLENISSDLQIYFSGVSNVAHAIDTRMAYEPFNIPAILSDLFRSVLYINSWFGEHQSALTAFNGVFYNRALVSDQILPMIGQGFLYFGPIIAPVLSVINILIVMYLDKLIYRSTSVFNIYIMVYLCIKFALFFMANMTIQLSFFTNFFLVLLLIGYLNKKVTIKRGST